MQGSAAAGWRLPALAGCWCCTAKVTVTDAQLAQWLMALGIQGLCTVPLPGNGHGGQSLAPSERRYALVSSRSTPLRSLLSESKSTSSTCTAFLQFTAAKHHRTKRYVRWGLLQWPGTEAAPSLLLHWLLWCCKGRLGRTILDHSPHITSLQQRQTAVPKPCAAFPANPGCNGSIRSGYKPASPHTSLSLMQQRQKTGRWGKHTTTKGLGPPKAFVLIFYQLYE